MAGAFYDGAVRVSGGVQSTAAAHARFLDDLVMSDRENEDRSRRQSESTAAAPNSTNCHRCRPSLSTEMGRQPLESGESSISANAEIDFPPLRAMDSSVKPRLPSQQDYTPTTPDRPNNIAIATRRPPMLTTSTLETIYHVSSQQANGPRQPRRPPASAYLSTFPLDHRRGDSFPDGTELEQCCSLDSGYKQRNGNELPESNPRAELILASHSGVPRVGCE